MVTRFGMCEKVDYLVYLDVLDSLQVVFPVNLWKCLYFLTLPVSQLGVMTYSDMTAQSPETQAAVEHEVRVLLKVCVHYFFGQLNNRSLLNLPP